MTSNFRQLIQSLPQAVLVHRGGRPLFVNPAFTGLTGCPAEDLHSVERLLGGEPWKRLLADAREQAAAPVVDQQGRPLSLRTRRTEVTWKGAPAWLETLERSPGQDPGAADGSAGDKEYRILADTCAQGVLVHRAGQVLYANAALVRLLGYRSTREAYRGNQALTRFDPAHLAQLIRAAQADAGPGADGASPSQPVDVSVTRTDGAQRWFSTWSAPIDWQGEPAIATTAADATERIRAEQTALARDRNQRHAEEVAHIGHWEWDLSSQNIAWSAGTYRIYGRSPETFQPTVKNALTVVHPEDRDAVADALNVALREGRSFTQEFRALSPDGTVRQCVDQVTVDRDAAGQAARLFGVLMDVTDRRRTERELNDSRRLLETVLQTIPHGVFVKGADGRYLLANSAYADLFGIPADQLTGQRPQDLPGFKGDYLSDIQADDQKLLTSAETMIAKVVPSLAAKAPDRMHHLIKLPLRDERGAVIGVVGMVEDVTLQQEAERELKAQQRLLHTVMETFPQGLFVKDAGGRFLLANSAFAKEFALTPDQVIGLRTEDLPGFNPDLLAVNLADDRAILGSGETVIRKEEPSPAPMSRGRLHRRIKLPLRDERGAVIGIVGMVEDITQSREAERKLEESEQLLKSVLESIPQALLVKNRAGRYLLVNSLFASRFSMTPEQVHGKLSSDLPGVTGEFLEMTLADDKTVLDSGQAVVREELPAPSPTQKGQWRRLIKQPLRNSAGELIGLIGTTEDITQRHRAEQHVKESEQLLKSVVESIPHGLFVKDLEGRFLLVNSLYAAQAGLTPDQVQGKRMGDLPGVSSDFAAAMSEDDRRALASGKPAVRETPFLPLSTGAAQWLRIVKQPLRNREGAVIGLIGTTEDITQRREAEQQVKESQRLLQTIIDTLPQAIFLKDLEGRFLLVNDAYGAIRGIAKEDAVGKRSAEASRGTAQQTQRWVAMDAEVIRTDRPVIDAEFPYVYPDGHEGIRTLAKLPFHDASGALAGVLGVSEDITERKQAQERLHASERLLQAVFDTIPHSVFVKDRQGRYLSINHAMAALWHTRPEDVVGQRMIGQQNRPAREYESAVNSDREVLEFGRSADFTPQQTLPDGRVRTLRVMKSPLRDDRGEVIGLVGTAEDITERVEAVQRLHHSERLLQTVIDTLPQAVFLKDLEGRFVVVNEAYARIHGRTKEQILQTRTENLPGGAPEQKDYWLEMDRRVIDAGQAVWGETVPFTTPSGTQRILSLSKIPFFEASGALGGILGVSEDITDRQQAEQRLRNSERLLQTIIDTLPQAIFLKDREGRYLLANDAYARIRGVPKQEIVGTPTLALHHPAPDEVTGWIDMDRQVIESGQTIGPAEGPFTMPDGSVAIRMMYKLPLLDESGAVTGVLGVSEDVTARRQAEQRLKESEQLLQTVLDTIPLDLWVKNRERRFVRVNATMARRWGLTPEQMVGQMSPTAAQAPEGELGRIAATDLQVLEEGRVLDLHIPRTEPSGRRRTQHQIKTPLRDAQGAIVGIVGIAEDVTELRHAEQELRASQRLLQTVFDTIPHRLWIKDPQGRFLMVNPPQASFYGMTPEQMVGTATESLPGIPPELSRVWRETDAAVVASGQPVDQPEVYHPRLDGSDSWARLIKLPLRDDQGRVIAIVGLADDVTDRKRAGENLRASERLLQTVFDTIPHSVFVKDREGRYVAANRAMSELWHASPEDIVGHKVIRQSQRPGPEALTTQQSDREVMETGRPAAFVRNQTLPDGLTHRLSMKKTPLLDEQGRVIGLVGTVEDVTEQERAAEDLRASQRLLKTVFDTIPFDLWIKDRESRYVMINPAMARRWGIAPESAVGQSTVRGDQTRPDELQLAEDTDRQVLREGRVIDHQMASREPSGEPRIHHQIKAPLRDEQGRITGLVGIAEDVTDRLRATEELRAKQSLLNAIINAIPHGLVAKDVQGRFVLVNPAILQSYGCTAEELLGRTTAELSMFSEAVRQQIYREDMQVISSGQTLEVPESGRELPGGRMSIRRVIRAPILDADGRVTGLVVINEDITQRKRAERELQESQRLLKTIFDHLPYGLSAKDRDGRFVLVNQAMLRRFGATPADFVGRTAAQIPVYTPEDRAQFEAEDRQVLETGQLLELPRHEVRYPDGTAMIRRFLKIPITDEQGRVTGLVTASEDITQQVRGEQELLRGKALLESIFNTIPHDIWLKDRDSRFVSMNRRVPETFGLTEQEMMGRQTPLPVTPEDLEGVLAIERQVMTTGQPHDGVQRRTMADGTFRYYRVIKSPLRDEAGQIAGIVGIGEDITERVAAEAALRDSKALLETVFDTIPHDLWVKDREARYVSANKRLLLTFNRTLEGIAGRQTAAPATPAELEVILDTDFEVINSGRPSDVIQSRKLPDGSVRQFRVMKTPLRDEAGRVAGLVGLAEDVTERARSEQQLRENRLLLQTVFDALPLWVFVKDRERRLIMVNRQMAADYGGSPGGIMSGGGDDPADAATQAAVRELDEAVLASGQPVEAPDLSHTLRGGPTRIMRSLVVPLTDPEGRVTGIVGVSEDITERKRAEQALLQTQKLESLGILAGGIAHDFNNLLTGILGNVELALLDLEPSSHARAPLTNVKNASLMAAGLTRQMLAYSGGGRFELRPIVLNSLVEDMAQLLRVTVPRNVSVVYRFEPDLPQVEADASQLQQVIMNLITNAAEAIGDRPGEVVLTTGTTQVTRAELATYHLAGDVKEGRYNFLEAADTGCGMPPETLQRIFDPFFTTKFTGRGLGLAAVLGIVRSHKGAIRVTSQVDKGTVFRILLPAGERVAAAARPAATGWSGGGTVLVVDDEPPVRQVAAAMLRELGMTVLEAGSGEAAVRQLREQGAEVGWVLLDASMPGLSGAETLRALRQIVPRLVVVMMSGYGERELQERFRGQDVRGFLQKPFTFEDLSGKLNQWLGRPTPGGTLP